MNDYPEAVSKIANDYVERLRSHLRLIPEREQDEFLREIQSHLYEAYQETPGQDEIARILTVLRKLGEPAEVVADRLPKAMVRSGGRRVFPLYVVGGIFLALFGLPLGFGGVGVLVGLLGAVAGIVVAYYSVAGSLLLVGAVTMLLGLTRLVFPGLWDQLVTRGYIQTICGPPVEFLGHISPANQGLLMIVVASMCAATGVGMLRLGTHLLRGLRFVLGMLFDWIQTWAQKARRMTREKTRSPEEHDTETVAG